MGSQYQPQDVKCRYLVQPHEASLDVGPLQQQRCHQVYSHDRPKLYFQKTDKKLQCKNNYVSNEINKILVLNIELDPQLEDKVYRLVKQSIKKNEMNTIPKM